MIVISTFIQAAAQALAADADLGAWCSAVYGKRPTVYINIDARNPPAAADCPYVMLRPEAARIGNREREKLAHFAVYAALHDDTFRTHADTHIIEYNGVQRICEFMQAVIRALAAVDLGNALLDLVEPDFETIDEFPFFLAGLPLAIREDYVLGADRLLL